MALANKKNGDLLCVEYANVQSLYDFDKDFPSWNFDEESLFDKVGLPTDKKENSNGTWKDEENKMIEIWAKKEQLAISSVLYGSRRAPEEDENVPEGYIKIESGVDYEVLKEGPIILTIITKGGPMEIKSIKFKDGPGSTAIRDVTYTSGKATADAWYTLDGRKLDKAPTAKGIYIYGDHKVVVK